jgi:S1-C subfamily serine protease
MLLFGLLLAGCSLLDEEVTPTSVREQATPIIVVATPTALPDEAMAPIDIEEQLVTNLYLRSVVNITARVITMDFFFGATPSEGTGSGFVLDAQGHIITNFHVIDGAESIVVTFSDETQVPAAVVGTDPLNDLAVLMPDELPPGAIPVELGDSAELRVGQRAIAIGNPFGLEQTLTTNNFIFNVIQTDAAINPGNSGGPLLNSRGQVIGVNTAIRREAEGIGFAVPVDTLKRVVVALIEKGGYPHPWLGILGYTITPELSGTLDLPVERGVLVAQLYRNSPAARAGVRGASQEAIIGNRRILIGGDIITAVNGTPIRDWTDYLEFIELQTGVGDSVTLSVLRAGQEIAIEATTLAQPQ